MRLPIQVEAIVFKMQDDVPLFLMLKRNEKKGGFWQPVTGGVEEGEEIIDALYREIREELAIDQPKRVIPEVYYFEFEESYGLMKEYVFGIEIDDTQEISLSPEHVALQWCTETEAINLMKYETNKEGLRRLTSLI